MALHARTRLGTYEVLGPLGVGGMGEVYRAKDLRLGRDVAIKVLPAEFASSPDRLARFEREARLVAGLNHPNIVTLHSVEDEDGLRFLTMELVEGQSLSMLVAPGGLALRRLLEIVLPLTDALAAAHEKGVIHRDLKPGNVMVTHEGRVKVLDFGLAKVAPTDVCPRATTVAATADEPISGEGQIMGTAPYMAPEQIRGESLDARSDLFSLGILMYELATGRRPFRGESSADVSSSILRDTPVPVQVIREDLPRDLDRIVGRCLEKSPRDRFQAARDVYNDLRYIWRELERSGGVSAPTPAPPMPVVTPMTRTPSAAPASASAPARKDLVSIAVLPFVNRSASVDDEYFSDGLADELLSVLAKINGLRVIARSSAFVFKGKQVPVAEIGKALDVATLLEGSVRKAANRIRVSVQLVSVVDNSHLWSETYDRTLEDIFAVQDDIAQSVVKELRTTLLGNDADADASGAAKAEVAQAAKGRATDPEAHRIYLQARHLLDRLTRENSMKGIAYLLESLELNPDFALAWTELGKAYSYEAQFGWVPPAEGFRRARQAVERGLLLEPDLAEGHAVKGWIQLHGLEFSGAEWSLRRALELAPGSALVLRWAGSIAAHLGRFEEAIEFYRRSIDRDPLSSAAYHNLGITLFSTHQLEEAAKAYRKALELSPERIVTHALLAELLSFQGRHVEALEEVMREPHESRRLSTLAVIHHAAGRYEDSEKALHEVKDKYASVSAYEIAGAHALRNEPDQAFEWLERAYTQSDPILWEIKSDSWFQFLHDDLRWSAFLKKIGLAD